jgi:uncharacterized protein (TIGR00106 family)
MAIAEITVVPSGVGPSVSEYVARAQRVLANHSDVKHMLTPMSTILEGDMDAILAAIRDVHDSMFDERVVRVLTLVKIDERRDKKLTMQGKIESVEAKLRA